MRAMTKLNRTVSRDNWSVTPLEPPNVSLQTQSIPPQSNARQVQAPSTLPLQHQNIQSTSTPTIHTQALANGHHFPPHHGANMPNGAAMPNPFYPLYLQDLGNPHASPALNTTQSLNTSQTHVTSEAQPQPRLPGSFTPPLPTKDVVADGGYSSEPEPKRRKTVVTASQYKENPEGQRVSFITKRKGRGRSGKKGASFTLAKGLGEPLLSTDDGLEPQDLSPAVGKRSWSSVRSGYSDDKKLIMSKIKYGLLF